jgi:hypothetical protein
MNIINLATETTEVSEQDGTYLSEKQRLAGLVPASSKITCALALINLTGLRHSPQ